MSDVISSILLSLAWTFLICQAWLLASCPKFTILYLRRFRLTSAQAVVSAALEQGLGRRYRIITLDDARFPPMEVPRLYRRLSRYGGVSLWIVFMLVMLAVAGFFLASSAPTITGIFSTIALAMLVVFVLPGAILGFSATCLIVTAALLSLRWTVRRRSRISVQSSEDVQSAKMSVADLAGWTKRSALLAPRATIVRVNDALWQDVVERLAQTTHIVLVDLSVPTANLEWELTLLSKRAFQHTVFVANRRSETAMAPPPGHACLFYDDQDNTAAQDFFEFACTCPDHGGTGSDLLKIWGLVDPPCRHLVPSHCRFFTDTVLGDTSVADRA
jgi:hypothetical protein